MLLNFLELQMMSVIPQFTKKKRKIVQPKVHKTQPKTWFSSSPMRGVKRHSIIILQYIESTIDPPALLPKMGDNELIVL